MELMYQGKDLPDYNFIVDDQNLDIKLYNSNSLDKKLTNADYKPVNIEERRNEWFYPCGCSLLKCAKMKRKRTEFGLSFNILKKKA